jgi:chemotaxis protein methyltransferase CheR
MKAMSDREFTLFRKLIYTQAGICLTPPKKALLEARLGRRLRELGIESFLAYYEYAVADMAGGEIVHLLDRISTNETRFFREPKQFEFLEQNLLPTWISLADRGVRPARVRVWSAGCSTGEEPYSLAMILLDGLAPHRGWQLEIVGTDLSSQAVAAAQKAIWPITKAKEIPDRHLKRFMLKGTGSQAAHMKAGAEIRSIVRFQHLNLNDPHDAIDGIFDLIFCRNVLIYFDAESRARVVHRLIQHMALPGYLFVGHAESLNGVSEHLRHVIPTVYHYAPSNHRASRGSPSAPRTAGAVG